MATPIRTDYYRLNENGTWDLHIFRTRADQVDETDTKKIMTSLERTQIKDFLTTFNKENELVRLDTLGMIPDKLIPTLNYLPITGGALTGDNKYISNISRLSGGTNDGGGLVFFGDTVSLTVGHQNMLTLEHDPFGGSTLSANNKRFKDLGDPVQPADAVTLGYVQQLVSQGTHVVGAVRVASTGNITSSNGYIIGVKTIDGITLAADDRVLLKDQDKPTENGVYIVSAETWTKIANDSDKGSLVFTLDGNTNKGVQYYNNGTEWVEFFVQDTYQAAENGGLALDASGFGFKIADNGIVTKMIKNGQVTADKLAKITGSESITGWNNMATAAADYYLKTHIDRLYSAIKLSRGTANYNTDNTQTIAGAYAAVETKNRVVTGAVEPTSKIGYNTGDIYLRTLS